MSTRFKTIVIDDETLGRNRLKRMLEEYTGIFDIVAEAQNGEEGLILIEAHKPDVIFLDIQMPGLNGFEMLKKLTHTPTVVFTTAYEEYAIKAFEENSVDYLLKPIEPERLKLTVEKLKKLNNSNPDITKLLAFVEQNNKKEKEITSIPVKRGDKITLIKLQDIVFLEAKEKYVFIHDIEGREHLVDYTLTELEEKLPKQFLRVHRAFIINKERIKEIRKYFDGKFILIMDNKANTNITSGSSFTQEVRSLFNI